MGGEGLFLAGLLKAGAFVFSGNVMRGSITYEML